MCHDINFYLPPTQWAGIGGAVPAHGVSCVCPGLEAVYFIWVLFFLSE